MESINNPPIQVMVAAHPLQRIKDAFSCRLAGEKLFNLFQCVPRVKGLLNERSRASMLSVITALLEGKQDWQIAVSEEEIKVCNAGLVLKVKRNGDVLAEGMPRVTITPPTTDEQASAAARAEAEQRQQERQERQQLREERQRQLPASAARTRARNQPSTPRRPRHNGGRAPLTAGESMCSIYVFNERILTI